MTVEIAEIWLNYWLDGGFDHGKDVKMTPGQTGTAAAPELENKPGRALGGKLAVDL